MPWTWPCPPEGPGPSPHTCSAQALDKGHPEPRSQRPQTQPCPPASLLQPWSHPPLTVGRDQLQTTACWQDSAHSPAGQHQHQGTCTPPTSGLTPATELRGPQPDPRTGSSCQRASTSPRLQCRHLVGGEQPQDYLDLDLAHLWASTGPRDPRDSAATLSGPPPTTRI